MRYLLDTNVMYTLSKWTIRENTSAVEHESS